MDARTCFWPSGVYTAAAAFWITYGTPLNLVDCRRNHKPCRLTASPAAERPMSSFGTTVKAQRVPVNPAVFEKLRNSMATSRAPSTSKMEWGSSGSRMYASYAASYRMTA